MFSLDSFNKTNTGIDKESKQPIDHDENTDEGLSKKASKLEEELERRKRAITWISEMQWQTLERLSKVPPFNRPNIVNHVLDNSEQWLAYATARETENVNMPGPYLEYDPVKEEKRMKHKKKQLLQRKKDIKYKMMKIEEMTEGDDES